MQKVKIIRLKNLAFLLPLYIKAIGKNLRQIKSFLGFRQSPHSKRSPCLGGNVSRRIVVCLVCFWGLHLSGIALSEQKIKGVPVIIDTDCAIQDMMAILYLLNCIQVDIQAITTVGNGMSRLQYGTRNVLNLLELAGYSDIPVAYGAQTSLSPAGFYPLEWRKQTDHVMGIKLPDNPKSPVLLPSWQLMVDMIVNSRDKLSLLCLGPLTNLAIALEKAPAIKDNIKDVYIAGGAVTCPGNLVGRPQGFKNLAAEYNIFLDAQAAHRVLQSGLNVVLIPLEIARSVPVSHTFYQKIKIERHTSACNFVYEILNPFKGREKKLETPLWSPLAAALMMHPEMGRSQKLKVNLNLKKGPEYGKIIMDKSGGYSLRIFTDVNVCAFYNTFLRTLNHSFPLTRD